MILLGYDAHMWCSHMNWRIIIYQHDFVHIWLPYVMFTYEHHIPTQIFSHMNTICEPHISKEKRDTSSSSSSSSSILVLYPRPLPPRLHPLRLHPLPLRPLPLRPLPLRPLPLRRHLCEHHIWTSHMNITYEHHIRTSHMNITYEHHMLTSYFASVKGVGEVIYKPRFWE